MREPNRLIHEKSPYLLQHADNPVDWYPWGEEAFERAENEDKLIFLSIGYSTCHWCHVMERESFEDDEVAERLNRDYIAVKVDREERPDIDHVYMTVCQLMTGQGGWPLTVVLTPDQKPIFAGTYFPKESKWGRAGLLDILEQIAEKWRQERDSVQRTGNQIANAVVPHFDVQAYGDLDPEVLHEAYRQYDAQFDETYGGFGPEPKFPSPHNVIFLLRYYKQSGEKRALDMVETTLDGMYRGGMYDHIGFGFSRYATDEKWLVPHFEKMLYDNAMLAYTYLEAYQVTHKHLYREVAEQIFTYVLRDMTDSKGGFFSAEDADSEGVEGKFYVWTPDEVKQVLGPDTGELVCDYYGITEGGNFEGKSIPNLIGRSLEAFATSAGMSAEMWQNRLHDAREKLFRHREQRIHPHKDDKILTSWNGLMIAALAKGAKVLQNTAYREAAEKAARFLLTRLRQDDGRLLARYRDGEAAHPAYLDDYAFLVWGLHELYEATWNVTYLQEAVRLNEEMLRLFWDDAQGGCFFTARDSEALLARPKEIHDGAIPSGNSVAAYNLVRLAHLTGSATLQKKAEQQVQAFAEEVRRVPTATAFFLTAVQLAAGPMRMVVIAGERGSPAAEDMLTAAQQAYVPGDLLVFHPPGEAGRAIEAIAPSVKGQRMRQGQATAYVCENYACQEPVTDVGWFKRQLQM